VSLRAPRPNRRFSVTPPCTTPQVEDLDGNQLYQTLGVSRRATPAELRSAFRAAARTRHPDKGGDARAFAALRQAFEARGAGAVLWGDGR
jgi:hypothetical protein